MRHRLEAERAQQEPVIEEGAMAPAELQSWLCARRLSVPELELLGTHAVRASWSDTDHEVYELSPYELALCRAVTSQLSIPVVGWEGGGWPGGLRWDEIPGWKRRIWMEYREAVFERAKPPEIRDDVPTGRPVGS